MAAGKEIRTKISSIQSTQKITSAMEMVAASKMRRAQDRMEVGKPYARRMRSVIGHLANSAPEYRHTYLQGRAAEAIEAATWAPLASMIRCCSSHPHSAAMPSSPHA